MRKHSTVLTQIFLQIHPKQRFRLKMYMYIRSLLLKRVPAALFSVNLITFIRALLRIKRYLMCSPIYAMLKGCKKNPKEWSMALCNKVIAWSATVCAHRLHVCVP